MKIKDVAKLSPTERFLYWIRERHSIYLKRKAGKKKPWTDDEILQQYRFCNVRRIDDKVSQWLLKNWYKPYFDHPNMLAAVALARFLNLPRALERIGFPEKWDRGRIKRMLRADKRKGLTVFNAAYRVCGKEGADKLACVLDFFVRPLIVSPPVLDTRSMKKCWGEIIQRHGFGSFLAGQVVADLRWAMSGTWRDKRQWAPAGPGSQRGLNRLHEKPLKTTYKQEDFSEKLKQVISDSKSQLPPGLVRSMEAIDWQNCLCEYDKFSRVLLGEGRPKQRYQGV